MKLLICDDDISTIDVIQSQLDYKELGISQIFRAYNGQMAKDIIDKEDPDLILCDIEMPMGNGIEVLKHAYEKDKEIEFSFLTCYESFEYAQKAIQYGVTSYLTKPLDLEEVKVCIQKMAANVRKNQLAENEKPHNQYDSLMSSIFRQASDGVLGSNKEIVEAGLKANGIDFSADSLWRIVFTCADMTDAIRKTWNKDLLLYTFSKLHDEALLDYVGSAHSVINSDDRFLWCLCFVPGCEEDAILKEKCEKLIGFSDRYMSLVPVALISGSFHFYEAGNVVANLYDEMRKIRYFSGKIFFLDQEISVDDLDPIRLNENQVLWYLKKRDEAGYSEYIFNRIENLNDTSENLDRFRKELINIFITHFRDNGMSSNIIFMNPAIMALDEKATASRKGLMNYAMELFRIQQDKLRESVDSEDIIVRAKKYIDENYRENIDRNDVAAVTFVTPNYLSKLFKNNMNMNLREYINQLRIEEAKRLLLSTSMSVSEIASNVGYYNISYFSTVFHKLVGVSPFDWRNQKGGQDETE
ncbi:MAG: helix-turn-helix domain-containing protein [Erysipelotrichaceae bacterium]|nr:helix-turn-helix domain-containing protein [Erysipelotrichaceae bacterium]